MRAQRRHREAPSWQRGAGTTGEQPARQHSCLPVHLLALPCRLEAGEGAGNAAAEREANRRNPQENRVFLIALKLNTHPMESHLQPYLPSFPSYITFHIPYPICYSWKTPRSESELFSKTRQTCWSYSYHRDASTPCHRQSCRKGSSDPHEQHALFQSKAIPSRPCTICPSAVNFIGAAQ